MPIWHMKQANRIMMGMIVLAVCVLAATSVVCLASGEVNMMMDCGSSMHGAVMCPFMTAGFPAVITSLRGREMSLLVIFALVCIACGRMLETLFRKAQISFTRWHASEKPPRSFVNIVVRFISQGVLHPRIFSF